MKNLEITDYHLTKREKEILSILWNSPDGLIASDIAKQQSELSINTVQAVLKKLFKKNLIEIAEIVYSGTVLSRKYRPTLNECDFETASITHDIHNLSRLGISPANFFLGFLDKVEISDEDADNLLELINARKSKH